RLQARGYLVRGKSQSDGRKQTINLTDGGRRALATAKEAITEHERWLKSRFTDREVETLIEMLSRIHE
ncbi:MAG: MarR family transcriptional regulator, partial [Novosphingobium sp.]